MKDPDNHAALRRWSPGPLIGCMKNGESGVSLFPPWGGVMKDPRLGMRLYLG